MTIQTSLFCDHFAHWANVQELFCTVADDPTAQGSVHELRSHLVSYRRPDGVEEELNADDRQQADAHSQDDS